MMYIHQYSAVVVHLFVNLLVMRMERANCYKCVNGGPDEIWDGQTCDHRVGNLPRYTTYLL